MKFQTLILPLSLTPSYQHRVDTLRKNGQKQWRVQHPQYFMQHLTNTNTNTIVKFSKSVPFSRFPLQHPRFYSQRAQHARNSVQHPRHFPKTLKTLLNFIPRRVTERGSQTSDRVESDVNPQITVAGMKLISAKVAMTQVKLPIWRLQAFPLLHACPCTKKLGLHASENDAGYWPIPTYQLD